MSSMQPLQGEPNDGDGVNTNKKKEFEIEKEYHPFDHPMAKHPTTYWDTLVHMFKGTVGTGILSLPIAFSQAGYLVGIFGVLITTYFSAYCAQVLARSEVELCKRRKVPTLSYQATTYESIKSGPASTRKFATFGLHLCNVLILLSQIGSACIYMIFIASNVKAVTDVYIGVIDIRTMMIWCSIPLMAVSLIRKLKYLAPFSSLGSFTVLAGCAVVFYYMFTDLPPISTRKPYGPISELPHFFGTVFFASGSICLVLPLQNEMKNPRLFTSPLGVVNTGTVAVALLYTTFGFFGYIKYGDGAQGSVTLNLPPSHVSAHVVQLMLAVATLISTALTYYVSVTIICENYVTEYLKKHMTVYEYALRVGLVFFTVVIALVIPNLELLVSLIGVLCHCTLASFMPCLIHIFTFYPSVDSPLRYAKLFSQDVVVIVFTTVIFFTGMTSNIYRVVEMYE